MNLLSVIPFAAARGNSCGTNNGLLPGLYDGLCSGGNVQIDNAGDIFIVIANVVRILTALAGGLAVIMIIVGGIYYVTSGGDPKRITLARTILIDSVTGLLVIILAYAAVTFIAGSF